MKWTIIVMVLGTSPVDTGLEFPTSMECGEQAFAINSMTDTGATFSEAWQGATREGTNYFPFGSKDEARKAVWQSFGAHNVATCVPMAK